MFIFFIDVDGVKPSPAVHWAHTNFKKSSKDPIKIEGHTTGIITKIMEFLRSKRDFRDREKRAKTLMCNVCT